MFTDTECRSCYQLQIVSGFWITTALYLSTSIINDHVWYQLADFTIGGQHLNMMNVSIVVRSVDKY